MPELDAYRYPQQLQPGCQHLLGCKCTPPYWLRDSSPAEQLREQKLFNQPREQLAMAKSSFTVKKRECKIGPSINTRTEKHGDNDVPAADVEIEGVMLDREELGELLGDNAAWCAFFNQTGKLFEPLFAQLAYALTHKFKDSNVVLYLGLAHEKLELAGVKLNRITLTPRTGGMTELTLQVQCTPDAAQMGELHVHRNQHASIGIRFGKLDVKTKAQPELPIGDNPDIVAGPLDEQPVA